MTCCVFQSELLLFVRIYNSNLQKHVLEKEKKTQNEGLRKCLTILMVKDEAEVLSGEKMQFLLRKEINNKIKCMFSKANYFLSFFYIVEKCIPSFKTSTNQTF